MEYTRIFDDVVIDAIITDPPYDMSRETLHNIIEPIHHVGNTVVFCKPENQYMNSDEILFWIKTPSTKNYSHHVGRFVEMILVKRGLVNTFNQLHWSQMTGVYDDRVVYPNIHPWRKPLSLIERLVRIYTNPGDLIYDPFMGSGVVGEACKNLGRKYIGIEIDREHYERACSIIGLSKEIAE